MKRSKRIDDELLSEGLASITEAAKFLSVGKTSIYKMMGMSELPFTRVGSARRIPWFAIKRYLSERMIGS